MRSQGFESQDELLTGKSGSDEGLNLSETRGFGIVESSDESIRAFTERAERFEKTIRGLTKL